eukprot:9305399-Ditylum_brightwellii.AAC.1
MKEGYKIVVLATKSGFLVNFSPDGQRAAVIGEQEYEHDRSLGKVENMIVHMMVTFVIAMDNHITLSCVISKLCEMGIGIVGTGMDGQYNGVCCISNPPSWENSAKNKEMTTQDTE